MEYLEKIFKRTGWTSLLTSLVFAILGILLITNPEGSTKVVSLIVGILFISRTIQISRLLPNKRKI